MQISHDMVKYSEVLSPWC